MAAYRRYLITTDTETGETIKVEEIDEAGGLSKVSADSVFSPSSAGSQQPQYIVNIFIGTGPGGDGAPRVTTQGFGQRPTQTGRPKAVGPKGPVAHGPKGPHEPDEPRDGNNGDEED
jgi:hypothetical protein